MLIDVTNIITLGYKAKCWSGAGGIVNSHVHAYQVGVNDLDNNGEVIGARLQVKHKR